jgi:hypothetical protein
MVKQNLGLTENTELPGLIRSIITTKKDFSFASADYASLAAFETALQNAIIAGYASRVYLWPDFIASEDVSEENIYEDTPYTMLDVRDGNYRYRFYIKQSLKMHKRIFTHKAYNGRVFLIDTENQVLGTRDSDLNFMGFNLQLLKPEKMKVTDGSVSTKSPFLLCLANSKEWDQSGHILEAEVAAAVNTVDRLADVTVTVVTQTTASLVVDVKTTDDSVGVSGLVVADFTCLDGSAAAQTLTGATESTTVPGRYSLTKGTDFVNGTINIKAASVLSITAYESTGAATVNIP